MTVETPMGTVYSSTTPATVGDPAPKMRLASTKAIRGTTTWTVSSVTTSILGWVKARASDLKSFGREFWKLITAKSMNTYGFMGSSSSGQRMPSRTPAGTMIIMCVAMNLPRPCQAFSRGLIGLPSAMRPPLGFISNSLTLVAYANEPCETHNPRFLALPKW